MLRCSSAARSQGRFVSSHNFSISYFSKTRISFDFLNSHSETDDNMMYSHPRSRFLAGFALGFLRNVVSPSRYSHQPLHFAAIKFLCKKTEKNYVVYCRSEYLLAFTRALLRVKTLYRTNTYFKISSDAELFVYMRPR